MPNKFSRLLELATDIARLPVARLEFRRHMNPEQIDTVYRYFTKRHPKYPVFRNKTVGAALVPLTTFRNGAAYMDTVKGSRNSAEHFARKAKSKGYVVVEIERNDFVDDIHAINTSVDVRQGKAMDVSYLEKQTHYDADRNYKYYGALSTAGKLMAYADVAMYGNFASFNRIIGVRNNDGVMHLLVTDVICRLIEGGAFNYLMYDTYFGARPGLKTFKTMLGFVPHRAKYSLQ